MRQCVSFTLCTPSRRQEGQRRAEGRGPRTGSRGHGERSKGQRHGANGEHGAGGGVRTGGKKGDLRSRSAEFFRISSPTFGDWLSTGLLPRFSSGNSLAALTSSPRALANLQQWFFCDDSYGISPPPSVPRFTAFLFSALAWRSLQLQRPTATVMPSANFSACNLKDLWR
eukprot:Gb_28644 [translate_table: standard]